MFARLRVFVFVALASVCLSAAGYAQQATSTRSAAMAGPRLDRTATAVRQLTKSDSAVAITPMAPKQNMGKPVALMVVGGAAIILGAAVIDGDAGTLFIIGGAVAVLIGLYQYLQ